MSPVVLVVDLADFPLVAVVQLVLVVVLVVYAAGVGVQAPLVRLRLRVKLVRRSRPSARGVQWNFEARLQVALNSNNFQLWFEQKQNILQSFHSADEYQETRVETCHGRTEIQKRLV